MKFFVGFLFVAVFTAGAVHAAVSEIQPAANQQGNQQAAENLESLRIRKAARSYGGAAPAQSYGAAPVSMPSVPCPKNYLFSCQPSLQPVACSQPAYHQGAYSEPIAQWAVLPQEN